MKYYTVKLSDKGSIAVDDTILIKDIPAAAGSKILEGFKPLFSAEVVSRLENKGYAIAGKTQVGEFGLDLAGEFACGAEKEDAIKGAAAEVVAKGEVKAALGVDVTGAPRRAAALSGISFLKPTYSTVSRYGVISTAASGEQVGVYAKNADGIKEIMEVIAGHDSKDGTSLKNESYDYSTDKEVKGKKVLIIKELAGKADKDVKDGLTAYAKALEEKGVIIEETSCDIFESAKVAWQILMSAETCNNLSRYDGVKYGYRAKNYKNIDELYTNTRTEGFNFLTKAVILYGSDVLSKSRYNDCYDKSLKVRRVIADKLCEIFEKYDAILTPVCSKNTFETYDIKDAFVKVFEQSEFTAIANLTGAPALTSGNVQLIGKNFSESLLLSLAKCVEREGK